MGGGSDGRRVPPFQLWPNGQGKEGPQRSSELQLLCESVAEGIQLRIQDSSPPQEIPDVQLVLPDQNLLGESQNSRGETSLAIRATRAFHVHRELQGKVLFPSRKGGEEQEQVSIALLSETFDESKSIDES